MLKTHITALADERSVETKVVKTIGPKIIRRNTSTIRKVNAVIIEKKKDEKNDRIQTTGNQNLTYSTGSKNDNLNNKVSFLLSSFQSS